jgi:hypothetical protein
MRSGPKISLRNAHFEFYTFSTGKNISDLNVPLSHEFKIRESVHRNNVLIYTYIQQDATLHSLFYLETALHVSGGTSTYHQERKQL